MPRAFLIRRHCPQHSCPLNERSLTRECSPERRVCTADGRDYSAGQTLDVSPVKPDSPRSPACLTRIPDYCFPLVTCLTVGQKEPLSLTVNQASTQKSFNYPTNRQLVTSPLLSTILQPSSVIQREDYQCPECEKRYSTSSNLARHRQTHRNPSDKKARKCPHCQKLYVSMPAYSMHVRTHSQSCQCPYCGKCFSRPWLLQGHIRTHTGERPFKCPVCSKAFADKSNLRAHIQTHSSIKPYVCQRCGKAFALKSYLYKHEESSCMRLQRQHQRSNREKTQVGSATPPHSRNTIQNMHLCNPLPLMQLQVGNKTT
ncbi:uncharacterized protein LOC143238556 [Tachypleus tridentatus]|uniref:uncharacterized protein LOC143238556 n=1 Tax=Tachypleus tridentatus TaxID=6853 RepID=UPI003FD685C5